MNVSIGLQVYDLRENDPCTVRSTNETGVCLHLDNCSYNVKLNISNVCGFKEKESLICCPIEKRISAQSKIFLKFKPDLIDNKFHI